MDALRYTLLADGSSDQALVPILTWLLRAQGVTTVQLERRGRIRTIELLAPVASPTEQ